jgi:hypothetical protein
VAGGFSNLVVPEALGIHDRAYGVNLDEQDERERLMGKALGREDHNAGPWPNRGRGGLRVVVQTHVHMHRSRGQDNRELRRET